MPGFSDMQSYPNKIIGCQAVMHTHILCSAQQIAIPHRRRPLSTGGSCLCDATAPVTAVDMLNPKSTACALPHLCLAVPASVPSCVVSVSA